jgi:hypothetical protein
VYLMPDRLGQQTVILAAIWFVEEVRERLVANKQRSHRFRMKSFNLRKLKEIQRKELYVYLIEDSNKGSQIW